MKSLVATNIRTLTARFIFLILPTALLGNFILWQANNFYSILQNNSMEQASYLLAGMVCSLIFYAFRFRFFSSFALLLFVLFGIYKGLDATAIGEFDTFFISIRFLIFSSLFSLGWLIGAGFARFRYAHYLLGVVALMASVLMIAKQQNDSFESLISVLIPSVLYCFYLIFAAEQIYNFTDKNSRFWWFMIRRISFFIILSGLIMFSLAKYLRQDFEQAIETASGSGKNGENGLLKKNKNGQFDINDYAQLRSNQGRSNELLFAAHIDNFLPETDIPNPLYLTAFYYTKFDTSTETFERDKLIPYNDLFLPNVAKIPLYSSRTDSTVIKNSLASKARKVVLLEVYNKQLSPETYLAPNVGYFVQPIAIEKDYRSEFRSAFRAKAYVSELNSAYFVYNAQDPQLQSFQEQRFAVLRQSAGYQNEDKQFIAYYTKMPTDAKFQQIAALAKKITANKNLPVDKVIAIRDYFLSKDEEGNPLYSYTDNPGVPDIPSASKLMYFLFENHKGYCAYYAGATLFMLRALGIPSRIAVGFMTVDRSSQNKGWYWYYADQAHAWVQVYFPGFGWLDFDTTVGNDDAQQSPTPDGTPPMQPPQAWFATMGQIISIDTAKKKLGIKTNSVVFHDKEVKSNDNSKVVQMDYSHAAIRLDSAEVTDAALKIGDSATVVSYSVALKNTPDANAKENLAALLKRLPNPIAVDDIYLKSKNILSKESTTEPEIVNNQASWKQIAIWMFVALVALIALYGCIPFIMLAYFRLRQKAAASPKSKVYFQYRSFMFYLHQLGFEVKAQSVQLFARDVVDATFETKFEQFMQSYLALKYGSNKILEKDWEVLLKLWETNVPLVKAKIPFKKRVVSFLKPSRAWAFYYDARLKK